MTVDHSLKDLVYEVDGEIARITINRPEARNAFTFEMYEKLQHCCEAAAADPAVRVLIVMGAGGKAFSAGTDIALFRAFRTPEDALGYETFMERVLSALERCPVPTIAAISGACTGGGAAIAACCDLRIGTGDAKFGFPIARTLGNCLSVANLARLSALVGPARAKDLIFTARLLGAEEALQLGLLSEVVADAQALESRVKELARHVASLAPLTLKATKEGVRRALAGERGHDDDLILTCYMSDDFREGMAAFLEKRTPVWRGS